MSKGKPIAEIINIGTELLIGSSLNTHQQYLSQKLFEHSIPLYRTHVCGDNPQRLSQILGEALPRANIIILTGGLGPTADDITITCVAKYFGLTLETHARTLKRIQAILKSKNIQLSQELASQCELPKGCEVFDNAVGSAPGLVIKVIICNEPKYVYLLPGPPSELKPIFEQSCLPHLRSHFDLSKNKIMLKRLFFPCAIETDVADRLGVWLNSAWPQVVGIYAKPSAVELALMASGETKELCQKRLHHLNKSIQSKFRQSVILEDGHELASKIGQLLKAAKQRLGLAESCTGGLISQMITETPGSTEYMQGAVVAYANSIKTEVLGVSSATIEANGAVSADIARAMSKGAVLRLKSDWGLSTTGIAGPSGGSQKKPVGTVYIGLTFKNKSHVYLAKFSGNRTQIQQKATHLALTLLLYHLAKKPILGPNSLLRVKKVI
ncbi:MAG: nicotinamide-nucleotide amidase [Candidatus Omnitrophota bacterium]|jgi:nicotinamide-nucleotide amidase